MPVFVGEQDSSPVSPHHLDREQNVATFSLNKTIPKLCPRYKIFGATSTRIYVDSDVFWLKGVSSHLEAQVILLEITLFRKISASADRESPCPASSDPMTARHLNVAPYDYRPETRVTTLQKESAL